MKDMFYEAILPATICEGIILLVLLAGLFWL